MVFLPSCGAKFEKQLKFCGECGKPMKGSRHEAHRLRSATLRPAWAAVTGTVVNRTTGLPQAGATVGLYSMGKDGLDLVEQAKSDAQGKFTINQEVQPGPHMIRATLDAVTYNLMLPPGKPATASRWRYTTLPNNRAPQR